MTFQGLVDQFLAEEFEASPLLASSLGLTEYDDRLDDLSAETFRRRDADATRWRGQFASIPDGKLGPDEQIDRDLALAVLRGREILADWESWRREPQAYTGPVLQGIFGLFLHRLRPDVELAESAIRRLAEAPRVVEQGIANLSAELAHPLILGRGAGAARGGARYLRELLPADVAAGPTRDRLAEAGAAAAAALERWVAHLDELAGRATGTWQLGEERYSRLLREREALPFDARALREVGRQQYDALDAEMRDLVARIGGRGGWAAVLEAANRDHPPTEEAMRAGYEEWTARARAFLVETKLVTLPDGERCLVEATPVFQRPVLGVASYAAPPAFSASLLGHFFVPFAPDGTSAAEIEQRLAANSWGKIPTTSVHEAYPGHHWHLVMRKTQPRRIRRVFGTPYFNEGWALYSERVLRERGFFREPLQELYHLNATIFRAARIVVDTSLHMGEMTHDEAISFMSTKTALPEATARAEVGRYCAWPTQASSYLTGCLRILDLRARYLAARGRSRRAWRRPGRRAATLPRHDRLVRQPAAWPGRAGRHGDGEQRPVGRTLPRPVLAARRPRLRRPRPDEAGPLAALHARSWQATYGPMLRESERALLTVDERRRLWDRVLLTPALSESVWVAVERGRVVGLVLATPSHDPDADATVGEIGAIHVEPGRHGQGIGGELLAAALEDLRAAGFLRATLWVIRENVEARRFYEGQGWRPDGTTKRGPMGDFQGLPVVDEVRYARGL